MNRAQYHQLLQEVATELQRPGGHFDVLYGHDPQLLQQSQLMAAVALTAADRLYAYLTKQAFELRQAEQTSHAAAQDASVRTTPAQTTPAQTSAQAVSLQAALAPAQADQSAKTVSAFVMAPQTAPDAAREAAGHYLGVDLGGTKLCVGEVDATGCLLRQKRVPSGHLTQRQALHLVEKTVDAFLAERPAAAPLRGMGVGLIGRVDNAAGTWLQIDHDRADPLPLAEMLGRRYGLPCWIDNDVRSATKAEMLFGCGRRSQNWVYLNVGTGIAAGIVSGGALLTGGHCNAGEVGHTGSGVALHAPCACGRCDCVETVASGAGLDGCARLLRPQYPDTRLAIPTDGTRVSAADIFTLYDSDALCRRLLDTAADALANLIMNLVRFCDPDTVVLGGGLMTQDLLYQKVLERLQPYTMRYVTNGVVRTGLDPALAGVLGAAANAIWALGSSG